MKPLSVIALLLFGLFGSRWTQAQVFRVASEDTFKPQNKIVQLITTVNGGQQVILFQTTLRVNTDGSPLSYHPGDLYANKKLALNNICNAVAVRKDAKGPNLCLQKGHYSEAVEAFSRYQASNFTNPGGYIFKWDNVLVPTKTKDGRTLPCVFKTGKFVGYYGSTTGLKNGLTNNKGECDRDDQLDAVLVPALVKAGSPSVLDRFGVTLGDLLIAYDPKTQNTVAAVIGDSGPTDNLGEGSIALNSSLSGLAEAPSDYAGVKKIGIEDRQIMVAIFKGTRKYSLQRPYTAANIAVRMSALLKSMGFDSGKVFIQAIRPLLK